MTRIVAGTVGGRTLRVPPAGTRPTSDRVREALFSRLAHLGVLDGAHVVDLYAGSGALGLEAASRGAAAVTLVDSARPAADVCRRNVADLALTGVRVVAEKAERFVLRPVAPPWDLVFLDPPYDLAEDDLAGVLGGLVGAAGQHAGPALAAGAVVVVERSSRSPEPRWPEGLEQTDRRSYGDTVVWFASPADGDEAATHGPGSSAPSSA
ncbi:16S rRNA (guanine(966)-N(2))-methyltransferase RsmD [Pengzhenrongella frigida]|uniref:16S rRNA (Guanine(966)-N(2))-methyltransferase RsmD n=1 Tax=Pengzhenrongella frigida TaxID=1259133 RepID=A0A4Q5MX76_9MICO|nr:16S rRNA (guanine(966)-N(2))-methyltransferase RsmD [Cellulomonas sp. HLT2-17]RYV50248.1 16S rRNA (guanine(966)-N(2))-methyltransferase RsmD [Cellulomonas sp. HLT2-17]